MERQEEGVLCSDDLRHAIPLSIVDAALILNSFATNIVMRDDVSHPLVLGVKIIPFELITQQLAAFEAAAQERAKGAVVH
jgi:hypothetical protein